MRRFEFSEGSANKFWQIAIAASELHIAWGKIGTTGQAQTKSFASDAAAQAELDKLVLEKTKKGYVEVPTGGAAVAPAGVAAKAVAPATVAAQTVEPVTVAAQTVAPVTVAAKTVAPATVAAKTVVPAVATGPAGSARAPVGSPLSDAAGSPAASPAAGPGNRGTGPPRRRYSSGRSRSAAGRDGLSGRAGETLQ